MQDSKDDDSAESRKQGTGLPVIARRRANLPGGLRNYGQRAASIGFNMDVRLRRNVGARSAPKVAWNWREGRGPRQRRVSTSSILRLASNLYGPHKD